MKKIIVLSVATVAILTFSGCNDNKKEEAGAAATTTVTEKAKSAVEATKDAAAKTAEAAKETVNKAAEATKEAAAGAADKAKEAAAKTAEAAKETAAKATEAVKETANKAKEAVAGGGDNKGAALFKKCASCHGADGKTKALGKSEVIAGQSADDLTKKLTEYKAGTRNVAGMGSLMNGQVKSMSDEDIKALATYISNLK